MKNVVSHYLNSSKDYLYLIVLASGLYPFLHFYNSNLSMSDAFEVGLMLAMFCFVLPLVLMWAGKAFVKIKPFTIFKSSYLCILNLSVFSMLIARIILHLNKELSFLILMMAVVLGMMLHKHLKKIVVLQLLVALISFVTLIPKIWFALHQNNQNWNQVPAEMLEAHLIKTPDIFVIQPDGYVNSSDLVKSPYSYDNSKFEKWLTDRAFKNYPNFRSNYYSTLTSNASMFAMKHHFYGNTNPNTLKTYNANNVIIGNENNVLKILKRNDYTSHLITDNSYFLSNRRELFFDYSNVPSNKIPYFDARVVDGIDMISDLANLLDSVTKDKNFFFIEKTIPGHITSGKNWSKGKKQERIEYLDRLETTNQWLQKVIDTILKFDTDALIIIVADHGGYVGLDYTAEVVERTLEEEEIISSFSSILSIKWPKNINPEGLDFKTNVNLFRQVFYSLSQDSVFVKNAPRNSSYLPLLNKGRAIYYEVINEDKEVIYNPISE